MVVLKPKSKPVEDTLLTLTVTDNILYWYGEKGNMPAFVVEKWCCSILIKYTAFSTQNNSPVCWFQNSLWPSRPQLF